MSAKQQVKSLCPPLYELACRAAEKYTDPRAEMRRGYRDESLEWNVWEELLREYQDLENSCSTDHPEWTRLFCMLKKIDWPREAPDVPSTSSFVITFPLLAFLGAQLSAVAQLFALCGVEDPFLSCRIAGISLGRVSIEHSPHDQIAQLLTSSVCVDLLNDASLMILSDKKVMTFVLQKYDIKCGHSALVHLVRVAMSRKVSFQQSAFEILKKIELARCTLSSDERECFISLGDHNCTYLLEREREEHFAKWKYSSENVELLIKLGAAHKAAILLKDFSDSERFSDYSKDFNRIFHICMTYLCSETDKYLNNYFNDSWNYQISLWLDSNYLQKKLATDPSTLSYLRDSVSYLVKHHPSRYEKAVVRWCFANIEYEEYRQLAVHLLSSLLEADGEQVRLTVYKRKELWAFLLKEECKIPSGVLTRVIGDIYEFGERIFIEHVMPSALYSELEKTHLACVFLAAPRDVTVDLCNAVQDLLTAETLPLFLEAFITRERTFSRKEQLVDALNAAAAESPSA